MDTRADKRGTGTMINPTFEILESAQKIAVTAAVKANRQARWSEIDMTEWTAGMKLAFKHEIRSKESACLHNFAGRQLKDNHEFKKDHSWYPR